MNHEDDMKMETVVFHRGKPQFNMVGQFLNYPLTKTEECISDGLARRLAKYALNSLNESGFVVTSWDIEVGTADSDSKPADRGYWVSFTNDKGGSITVNYILTRNGWPTLDHGLSIERA